MIRIHVICEGQTEEMFVNEVMSDLFAHQDIYLYPSLLGKPGKKGGDFRFHRLLGDLKSRLLDDSDAYCTTFFDFYGLPGDFPGKQEALLISNIKDKRIKIEKALIEELTPHIGEEAMRRFIPYVQMYEFEGLLFSQPESLANEIGQADLVEDFSNIRGQFDSPEHINNHKRTAPSKRIEERFDQYDKVIHGSLVALDIGLETIREECELFSDWVTKLLKLGE